MVLTVVTFAKYVPFVVEFASLSLIPAANAALIPEYAIAAAPGPTVVVIPYVSFAAVTPLVVWTSLFGSHIATADPALYPWYVVAPKSDAPFPSVTNAILEAFFKPLSSVPSLAITFDDVVK